MMTYLEYVAKRTGIKKEFIRTIFRHLENLEDRDNNSVTVKTGHGEFVFRVNKWGFARVNRTDIIGVWDSSFNFTIAFAIELLEQNRDL